MTDFPPLEVVCPYCNGSREIKRIQNKRKKTFYMMKCEHCTHGKVLTPFGQAVLDLVDRKIEKKMEGLEWRLGLSE